VVGNDDINNFGRKDTPTVEQIVRAAFYKEMRGLTIVNLNMPKAIHGSVQH